MKKTLWILLTLTVGCTVPPPRPPAIDPTPPIITGRDAEFTAVCGRIWFEELGRAIDPPALASCVDQARHGITGDEIQAWVHHQPEALAYRDRLEHAHDLPPLDKATFAREYQGDFGNAKLPGCGLYNDSVFDPVALLVTWTHNRPCFEWILELKGERGDNRVVVDPRADYRGANDLVDLWHEPHTFAAFLKDIRRHTNVRGEHFRVLVFLSGDGHITTFLKSLAAEAHFRADVEALAAAARDQIDGTAVCWECRHQRDYMSAATYEWLGRFVAQQLPDAWHGQHLKPESSSWSSANCGDPTDPACDVEPGDPNNGSEAGAWARCRREGWCDGLLYQFDAGRTYQRPDDHPNYTGHGGVLGRWWEIVVRMDALTPQADSARAEAANEGKGRHGWPSAEIVAFENIFDGYHDILPNADAYAVAFCQRALAIGGLGCGSASWRRPR